jgi:hypothetical protein
MTCYTFVHLVTLAPGLLWWLRATDGQRTRTVPQIRCLKSRASSNVDICVKRPSQNCGFKPRSFPSIFPRLLLEGHDAILLPYPA